jgi:hypothetical protein
VCLLQLNIHRFKVLARFGLMHIVATNLCVWIRTLVLESIKEITNNENRKYMLTSSSTIAPTTTAAPLPGQHLGQYYSHIQLQFRNYSTKAFKRSPMDQDPPKSIMLPPPAYFPAFPSSHLHILFS